MIAKPQFKSHFHIEIAEPETVYLLSEQRYFVLRGRLYRLLAPLLNGCYTVEEIISKLQGKATADVINYALLNLSNKGYITEADDTVQPEVAAFWNLLTIDTQTAMKRLHATKVAVMSLGKVPTEPLTNVLQSLNIEVCSLESQSPSPNQNLNLESVDFVVVLTDDYLQESLETFNQIALQEQRPWILIKPVGAVLWIGPIFHPGKTGCWECLAQRLRGNREVETAIQQQQNITTPFPVSRSILPSTLQTGLNLAATEIAKWIVNHEHHQLEGNLVTLDLTSLTLQHHSLVRRPQCLECGDSIYHSLPKPQPIVLNSVKKRFTSDGGHRTFTPEQTIKKYSHHISPITGVISNLLRISEGEDDLVHTYIATHYFGNSSDNLRSLNRLLGSKSAGKGKTDWQSKASAFCEAIERYCGLYTGLEFRVKGTYAQMGEVAIHPYQYLLFSEAQYQTRLLWNQQYFSDTNNIQVVPEPFDQTREIEWTPVWSLTQHRFKYLPTALCYYGYPVSEDHRFAWADSNGNAAGNTIEEAIIQGFFELVERDCVSLWWYNRVQRPSVDLASFHEPYLLGLQEYYHTKQRDIWVIDITHDLNIPTFAAISRRTDQAAEEILMGFGAHFDPKIAILRAVTEINQQMPFIKRSQEISKTAPDEQDIQQWFETATLENQPYLAADTQVIPKVMADYPQSWSDDLREDIFKCVEITAQHGLEILILDQTRPDIGMSVVKVIVPGLRHFWKRLAPGRLYDVPVKLGWLKAPRAESELNPMRMFI